MLKDIVNIIKDVSLRHKGVKTFRYQQKIYNNAQNNYKAFQVYLDDISNHDLNITTGIFKVEFQMYVLKQPEKSTEAILEAQDEAYTIAVNILGYLDNMKEYEGILRVYDFSIMTISHYSDDDSAVVLLSVVLQVPSPLNLCTLEDNFNDEPFEEEPDKEITVDDKEVGELTIKTIKLPKSPSRC